MEHFNGLSPAEAERLAMLAEEAGEIVQSVGKVLRHGYSSTHPNGGPDNREQLYREINDLTTVALLMSMAGDFPRVSANDDAYRRKLRYAHHQEPRP